MIALELAAYQWEPVNYQLRVGLDYLGQIYQTYQTPQTSAGWRAVLTHFPDSGPYYDLLDVSVSTAQEAKAAVDEALFKHQAIAAAPGGVS